MARRLQTPMSLATVFAMVSALMPTIAMAGGSALESETFATNATAAGQWVLPAGNGNTNGACLTAGPVSATTSVPNCSPTTDVSGSGALRLTTNAGDAVGAVFYQASLPTTEGLDVTLDTYQFNGTGADGIVFSLAAANPADPAPPTSTGPLGGDLGYAANTQSLPGASGMPYGYLGIGLDVYGNYENTPLAGGTGCTIPSPLVANKAYPESVTARGPGNGTVGYCILGTTATTYNANSMVAAAHNGTITNVGAGNTARQAVRDIAHRRRWSRSRWRSTRRRQQPPRERADGSCQRHGSSPTRRSAPRRSRACPARCPPRANNPALATFPSSWINPATGIPYQLTFGWTASTGGSNEYHEVNQLVASTLTG